MDAAALAALNARIAPCTACRLATGRTQTVPGDGDPNAEILFIGEAPGFHEDRQGRPFVGPAGRLLDQLLAEIGLTRADVFVANMVKCRPPDNRDPLPAEIAACQPFLQEQIAGIRPKLIVPLGRFAMNHFLPSASITRAHGRAVQVGPYQVYPVYHPAAALRQPTMLPVLREDFRRIPAILAGSARPAESSVTPSPPTMTETNADATQLSLF